MKTIEEILEKYKNKNPDLFKKRSKNYYEAKDNPAKLTLMEFSHWIGLAVRERPEDVKMIVFSTFVNFGNTNNPNDSPDFVDEYIMKLKDGETHAYGIYSDLECHETQPILGKSNKVYFLNAQQICAIAKNWSVIKEGYCRRIERTNNTIRAFDEIKKDDI